MFLNNKYLNKIKIIIIFLISIFIVGCGDNKNNNKSYAEENLINKENNLENSDNVEKVTEKDIDNYSENQINDDIKIDQNENISVIDSYSSSAIEMFVINYTKEKLSVLDKNLKQSLLDNFFKYYKDKEFLFSLNKNDVLNIFGKPDLYKNEESIEIWQYRDNACVLNFIWNESVLRHLRSYDFDNKEVDLIKCIVTLAKIKN